MRLLLCLWVLLISVFHEIAGETCVNWVEGNKECEHGCCGDYGDHDCCFHWKVYAIVGGVIGGLILIGGGAFLIFFLCYYQQEMKRKRIQPNTTIPMQTFQSPYPQTTTTVYPINQASQQPLPYQPPSQPYPPGSQPYPTGTQPYSVDSQMAPPDPPKYAPPY